MSWLQIAVVSLCFLLNFNDGIDVLLVSFAGEHIMKEWGLNNAELGYVFSAGLAGMTAGCFVLAPFGDQWGRRKVFLGSLFLISVGMLFVYFAPSLSWLLVFSFGSFSITLGFCSHFLRGWSLLAWRCILYTFPGILDRIL